MARYVLAIDQGTTGTTALLIDAKSLEVVSDCSEDYAQIYPKPGWVEHDLNVIWETIRRTVSGALKKVNALGKDISAIGITNQRETTCAYNSRGNPLYNAIVWQDRRTSSFCADHRTAFLQKYSSRTGLPLDPYFSGSKMKWLIENVPAVRAAADAGDLHLSTIDTYVLFKLSGCVTYATEPSNASRTQMMSLETFQWDNDLVNFFQVPNASLPAIHDSFGEFGRTKGLDFLPDGIPITCMLGDQQSALFGQACIEVGDIKCTYGTGAFLLVNTGDRPVFSKRGLLTTAAYGHEGKKTYAMEGACYIAGAAVQWLRDNLNLIKSSGDVEALASEVTDLGQMEHLLFFPFFTGIAAPYWVADAKAAIVGMTRDTGPHHLARACLDGIALSVNDCVNAFLKDLGKINDIRVDGGATANNLLMQSQANFSGKRILRPMNIETTSYGAAVGALVGIGAIGLQDVSRLWKIDRDFVPNSGDLYYSRKANQWSEMLGRVYL